MVKSTGGYISLVSRILVLIDRHDPLRLRALGAPADEYEPQARAIAKNVARCREAHTCRQLLWEVFSTSFGESAGSPGAYNNLADELVDLVSKHTRF